MATPAAPRVSVVIACYNLGAFLAEAVESVRAQTFRSFEILVVDDASTDDLTKRVLDAQEGAGARVIRSVHGGVARARNRGIRDAAGEFVLTLDADDRIAPQFLEKAGRILDADPNVGIVYSEAEYFGGKSGRWELPPFSLPDFLLGNTIAPCALFRRDDYLKTAGYNPNLIYGWEDFDFWLSLIERGDRKVVRIPELLFFYRWRADSMCRRMQSRHWAYSYARILLNHPRLYARHARVLPRYLWRTLACAAGGSRPKS